MAEIIRMPKMSDTMTEGVIARWLKKVGDKVKSGDILAEVETDKATMELENYEDGTLLHIAVGDGQPVAVDGTIAIIGQAGEDISGLLSGAANPKPAVELSAPATNAPAQVQAAPAVDLSSIKATVVRMPKMSDTMTEGVIARWLKKVGDKVKSGDILAEVETDKATMELENYEDGTLLYVGVGDGQSVAVDGIIAIIGEAGANYQALLTQGSPQAAPAASNNPAPVNTPAVNPAPAAQTGGPAPEVNPAATGGRVVASPLAKMLAKEKGLDISQIPGTGEGGRVVKRDVETFVPTAKPSEKTAAPAVALPAAVAGQESFTDLPVSQMRKTIARRMGESAFGAPHIYLTIEIDMDKAVEDRASLNEVAPVKLSFNDLVIKATAVALRKHPNVNSSWLGDKIRVNHHIHIGVAVAIEDGLLVPVVRFADGKSLSEISTEVKELATKAKNKKLQPAEMSGSTFTISNLGMFGIETFTSIINQPDSCIMSVGAIRQVPVVGKDGQLKVGNVMKVTLACDHRSVDGALGAAFLQTFKQLMEDPIRILI
ncbi:MAG: pyruvate dehydrogenase complex dihydrolipoamide acetyltransferase [Bernardetiaceae bacterium]|jgi:pyruvate dehydrogenase E2 component (dihydrolipoamide acetyltransferase)|nr:pyruvate dehydrogenase complex dihydrolipoamide acetyltransferase [Bernardetiaceae bacterium]